MSARTTNAERTENRLGRATALTLEDQLTRARVGEQVQEVLHDFGDQIEAPARRKLLRWAGNVLPEESSEVSDEALDLADLEGYV